MQQLNHFTRLDAQRITEIAAAVQSPFYLYDEGTIIDRCKDVLSMPNAFGLCVRYAMKANPGKSILRLVAGQGLLIDASSMMEARRAQLAGIHLNKIILTAQEVPAGEDHEALKQMMLGGLLYNVCSLRQLREIGPFAAEHSIDLSIRVHPGVGTGESASRNTGDHYSCFGIHLRDVPEALDYANSLGIRFVQVHEHIGSGGDPQMWRENIDLELSFIREYFPDAHTVSFGGGLSEARMPGETAADVQMLGLYAKEKIELFYKETGRKLRMEIEPGTYIMANAGYVVTRVMDKKNTGEGGFNFLILDGGMDMNARPIMYGSVHPYYVVSRDGRLLFSEYRDMEAGGYEAVVAGRCCESGDCQSLTMQGLSYPRKMAEPEIGDYVLIGGAGAYCSSMAPFNYNSFLQAPEVLFKMDESFELIRKRQTMEQLLQNEL